MVSLKKTLLEKIVSVLLVVVLTFTSIPVSPLIMVSAEEITKEKITNEENGNEENTKNDESFQFDFEAGQTKELCVVWGEEIPVKKAASTNQPDAAILYSSSDDEIAEVDASSGKVTAKKAGEVTITATIEAGNEYAEACDRYTLKIKRADLAEGDFSFEYLAEAEDGFWTVSFEEGSYTNKAKSITLGDTAVISYKIKEENQDLATINEKTGEVRFQKAGDLTIVAELAESDCYKAVTAEYKLRITGKKVEGFGFEQTEQEEAYHSNQTLMLQKVTIPEGIGAADSDVIYSIISQTDLDGNELTDGNAVASLNETDGTLAINRSGIVTVQAFLAAKDQYAEAVATYTLTIQKAEQENFGFTISNPEEIIFNDTTEFTNEAIGGNGEGTVTYSVEEGCLEYVEFENTFSPVLIIKKPCENVITITAVKAGDDCYKEASAVYQIKIKKDEQQAAFEYGNEILVSYGTKEYTNSLKPTESSDKYADGISTGAITYSIKEDDNQIVAAIDEKTGKLTFADKKIGRVTICAIKAGDDYYEEWKGEYTLKIVCEETPENPYTLSGSKASETKEWYIGEVTLTPADGYLVSEDNSMAEGAVWQETISYSADGIITKKQIYLKNKATGAITEVVSVEEFKIDQTKPIVYEIEYCENTVETLLNVLTFGHYKTDKLFVTVSAYDDGSGLESFTYSALSDKSIAESNQIEETTVLISETKEEFVIEEDRVKYTFEIPAEFRGNIEFYATDNAGNVSDTKKGEGIVVDNHAPIVEIVLEEENENILPNDTSFTNQKVTATIIITESNFQKEKTTVVLNEEAVSLDSSKWVREEEKDIWRYTLLFEEEGVYKLEIQTTDILEQQGSASAAFEIDKTLAEISASYDAAITKEESDGRYYYKEDIQIPITITEKNFDLQSVVIKVDGEAVSPPGEWKNDETDKTLYKNAVLVSGEGEHTFTVEVTDMAGNTASYQSETIIIDKTEPKTQITLLDGEGNAPEGYSGSQTYENYYDEDITVRISVSDTNIAPEKTVISINGEQKTYALENWKQEKEADNKVWYCDITLAEDNEYTVTAQAVDKADRKTESLAEQDFIVDKTAAGTDTMRVEYSTPVLEKLLEKITFGYYQSHVEVTLFAEDNVSGIDSFAWKYTREDESSEKNVEVKEGSISATDEAFSTDGKGESAVFSLTASEAEQFRGSVSFSVTDKAGNVSVEKQCGERINVVDSKNPKRTVTYSPAYAVLDKETYEPIEGYEYDSENTGAVLYYDGDITVTFTIEEMNFYEEDVTVKVNGKKEEVTGWEEKSGETDVWTNSMTLSGDGEYTVEMEYTDRSGNVMEKHISELLVIDTITPAVGIELLDGEGKKAVYETNENYFHQDITVKITAEDVNFAPKEAVLTINGEEIEAAEWTVSETNAAEWYSITKLDMDSFYDVKVVVKDYVGKTAEAKQELWVDKTVPGADKMAITYSTELKGWEKLLNTITFGYYAYAREIEVTLTAWDEMSGIDFFTWSYVKENGTSDSNVAERTQVIDSENILYSENGKKAVAKFKLKAAELEQFRGSISVIATDRANNSSSKNDNNRINIVDTISPARTVTYTQARQVVDASAMKTLSEYVYSAENTNVILYYDDEVTVTFEIIEANFYADDVIVKVNGAEKKITDWKQNKDVWTGTLTLSGDGDYIITMQYLDRSNNEMKEYKSEHIVIDTVNPVIEVAYENKNVQNIIEERMYYNDVQTAVITIHERNFRAADVIVDVTAKDIEGNVIVINNYAEYLANKDNWKQNGDSYTAEVTYSVEGNYEFHISYKDLAMHDAADYQTDYFTVDRTAPQNISISYSQSLLEQLIEAVTFGFYNASVSVTIQAEDSISGINEIAYSATREDGASDVNVQLIEALLAEAELQKTGKNATAEISIPGSILSDSAQFNGMIECKVSDRSKNTSDLSGDTRLIVDNIAPVLNVTFSEPVKEVNEISYYDDDITVTMEVNEANFYADDFILQITRDGEEIAVTPEWLDESSDIHIGTFTLHEDGDYLITADYTDKSENQMEAYQSKQLTIDTQEPTISISKIQSNEASKEDVYGFTITATDTNFDEDTFEVDLEAVLQDESGAFYKKKISVGALQTVETGKTYAYVVANLEEDAIYTLSCSVTDFANHTKEIFELEDGKEYESVQFSINRKGSNFKLSSETEEVITNYYIYHLENDIVIQEINVDPVEVYAVRMNGELLTEGNGMDYQTVLSGGGDEWSKRTYMIDSQLFEEEGVYNITIESVDKTETTAYSDMKNAAIEFVVDKSAPIVTISGLENGSIYETDEQEVTVMPTDEGGKLKSFTAIVLGSDGSPLMDSTGKDISNRISLDGEALLTHLAENDGKITFTVPEGLEQQVQIICTDYAIHADGSTNEYNEIFTKVTVTQSELVMFYANKPLFYGTIAGVTVPAAGIAGVLFRRKRKFKMKSIQK